MLLATKKVSTPLQVYARKSTGFPSSQRIISTLRDKTNVVMSASQMTLISFDVDGTLIHSVGENANKLHKDAFAEGFKRIFGLDTTIDVVKHHGSTDPLIIIKVLEHHGISKEEALSRIPDIQDVMINHFVEHSSKAAEGIEILPGVQKLLQELQATDRAMTCLVTGNLEPIGWSKMRSLGIQPLFSLPNFGGFSTDYCSGNTEESWRDRAEFVKIAAGKFQAQHPDLVLGKRFHVGDTPQDILAALEGGATAIGVATGIYTADELRAVAPRGDVIVLENLQDTSNVLKAFGLA
ncbi:hypothetical protein CEUSTIGMA_g7951.t1 [Chlamydomonas eustigma]|uniref:Uncharacterized protein n=1 Tax=Chlamydomonas eustigma TaxID=1157962 RepID=A0A250XBP9_9CHLO|nr:hypothetical protein CEUSTIGMA_g7951.t1 [Chlamydomonas eustigma]|eukprot:GAX80513.1 hypothetical protein CEUSTIGMA_g7951.t1 [Chlamydomonas eustigma]